MSLSWPPDLYYSQLALGRRESRSLQYKQTRGRSRDQDWSGTGRGLHPAPKQSPEQALLSWGMVLEAGARLPGRSVLLMPGLAAEAGGKHAVVGRRQKKESAPQARPRESNRRSLVPERAISQPSRHLSQASAGPAGPYLLSSRVSAGRPPSRGPRPRPLPAPCRGPRTPASPSATAEAAVGPIVVGIEVRHLPSPLREEPG